MLLARKTAAFVRARCYSRSLSVGVGRTSRPSVCLCVQKLTNLHYWFAVQVDDDLIRYYYWSQNNIRHFNELQPSAVVVIQWPFLLSSVVVLEKRPCPRVSLRTNLQVLVLVVGPQVFVLVRVLGHKSLSLDLKSLSLSYDTSPCPQALSPW